MTQPISAQQNTSIWQDGRIEVLTFDLQGETFALEAELVQEIVDLLPETVVPGSPDLVGAVINFRGKVIPLADLRVAFGMLRPAATVDSRIIVIELDLDRQRYLIGLKADKVHEVTSLDFANSEETPRVGLRWRTDYIRRLVKRGGNVLILPHLERIFSACEAAPPTRPTLIALGI